MKELLKKEGEVTVKFNLFLASVFIIVNEPEALFSGRVSEEELSQTEVRRYEVLGLLGKGKPNRSPGLETSGFLKKFICEIVIKD